MHKYFDITYPQTTPYPQLLALYLYIHYLTAGGTLLDVGCGRGEYVHEFRNLKMVVVGLDSRIETNGDLGYYKCNIENEPIPCPDNTFDFVFSKSVIEHVNKTEHLLSEIYRVLKPGGKAIIMTPDWESNYRDFYIDYSHVTPFTKKSLREALLIFGFKTVEVSKFYQLPFLWKHPRLTFLAELTAFLPDSFKWKDKEQTKQRPWIRFSKELMLLGIGEK